MTRMGRRHTLITCFVLAWTLLFHYETLRANYLSPLVLRLRSAQAGRQLPKFPLLFPPAGWIMFYRVDPSSGFAEVYRIRVERAIKLDPHQIFQTKAVGYDNIRRNVLIEALSRPYAGSFCRYLRWKFPGYESFAVVYAKYPDVIASPTHILRQVAYRCR